MPHCAPSIHEVWDAGGAGAASAAAGLDKQRALVAHIISTYQDSVERSWAQASFWQPHPQHPLVLILQCATQRSERTDRSSCNGEVATAIPASIVTTGIHRADALPAPRTVDRLQAATKPFSMTTLENGCKLEA